MATQSKASAGELDPSFGNGGKVIGPIQGETALLDNGKILTAGRRDDRSELLLVQHLDDGIVDESFGEQGRKNITLKGSVRKVSALKSQPGGRALIFGTVGAGAVNILYVVRILPGGELDLDFGQGGGAYVNSPVPGKSYSSSALAIQSDEKIILVAQAETPGGQPTAELVRLDSTGNLDLSFGDAGMVSVMGYQFTSVVALPDSRMLLGGRWGGALIVAFLSDGLRDLDFGKNGTVTIEIGSTGLSEITAIERQADGKIMAIGWASIESQLRIVATRINPDGTMDSTFNGGEPAAIEFPGYQTQGSGMAIQPDHKILAIAPASGASGVAFGLTRLLPNGAFDSEFGTQGRVITDMRGMDMAKRVAIQPDGKIVVSGWVWGNEQGIVRYIA
ncbi:delta-60 repeat domain-containing protein [Pseudomonas thivervalensis]|uniref:delta-60 repeat domain-containing protein n=1 Tax=Pseudomonas thivervalensis TaxID=86265 RepID=UPI00069E8AF6|nr:delta-60 repeat domain-containing protein [Pseudomonas thivervalensis]